ncbi:magnesium protoporphyrin IX methyltransferase [Gloeobacter morelensis]|uniref:Magnesium protoporphyrin IX methyltransferase n=1 Tax=Gloeobacter morelensis MG652769 TaxID=2781736 RepID=A0ABY3PFZ3_9CYAN|nr:magnesium protoporphyrin IX methyltransferase [Gloeobacter morelensis]UFP92555.1 magnesium protoporphyrin IX methyltransferase [Gloeobacter morelensis MG652769]
MSPMNDKLIVRDYFNNTGFERWRRIYGDEAVNRIQHSIRVGHQRTCERVLEWLGDVRDQSICDAGCGLGSLSFPLAERGARVFATDISEKMILEARRRQKSRLPDSDNPRFEVLELEQIDGRYDTVVCLDVLIHYPLDQVEKMLAHLSNRAGEHLILTYAPKTLLFAALKKVGEFFPGANKTTRAYQHRSEDIEAILTRLGWKILRRAAIDDKFYFARLVMTARPASAGVA